MDMQVNQQEKQTLERIWKTQAASDAQVLNLTSKSLVSDWPKEDAEAVEADDFCSSLISALGWPEWVRLYQKPVQAIAASCKMQRQAGKPAAVLWAAPGTGAPLDPSKEMPSITVMRADWAPTPESLLVAQDQTRQMEHFFILDETSTGFRLSPGGAREYYGLTPDAVLLGPGLAGGQDFAALAGRGPEPPQGGQLPKPQALAAAQAGLIRTSDPGFSAHLSELGRLFYAGLEFFSQKAKVQEELKWHGPLSMPRLEGRRLWAFLALAEEEGLFLRPLVLLDPDLSIEEVPQRLWARLARACARLRVLPKGDMAPIGWKDAASNTGCNHASEILSHIKE
jgi:hypothetical protein